jgi:hypothetical protein
MAGCLSRAAQIEISFAHLSHLGGSVSRPVELRSDQLENAIRAERRACLTCELGPKKPYAMTGPDGNDSTDRWVESGRTREHIFGFACRQI